jgi:hypothetical protein
MASSAVTAVYDLIVTLGDGTTTTADDDDDASDDDAPVARPRPPSPSRIIDSRRRSL